MEHILGIVLEVKCRLRQSLREAGTGGNDRIRIIRVLLRLTRGCGTIDGPK
jgi:hypothetical protein